jgi:alpha-mannosidase
MATPERTYTMHVISHTHWDREWYLPFEKFRMRLVDLMDHLLALLESDPNFKYFHLDGQTIVLEDYLQVRPHAQAQVRKFISEGRLLIGPWYLLNDLYLTSGESTVRNLLVGKRVCEDYGSRMMIGYLPDQFGNIGQMPQIFRGFGIDNVIFGRGRASRPGRTCEFQWQGVDGSQVLSVHMAFWYNNAQRFPEAPDESVAYAQRARNQLAGCLATNQMLFMNGVDHLEAQENLSPILAHLSEALKPDTIVHSTLPEFIAAVKQEAPANLEVWEGELREDWGGACLVGTLSSWASLKQRNFEDETLLTRYTEPLASFISDNDFAYDDDYLLYAWKTLLQNHPHDSICGCSVEETHADMFPRFRHTRQVAEMMNDRALTHLAAQVKSDCALEGDSQLLAFNPSPFARKALITAEVELVKATGKVEFELLDSAGTVLPYTILWVEDALKVVHNPIELPRRFQTKKYRIGFVADLPALGYSSFCVRPVHESGRKERALTLDGLSAENEFLRLQLAEDGSLTITDKASGEIYPDLNVLMDGGDFGDEYQYRAPRKDTLVDSRGACKRLSLLASGPTSVTYALEYDLELPLVANVESRDALTINCPVRCEVSLHAGLPRVDVRTLVENKARDHRLRACFRTGAATGESFALGQYDVVTRPIGNPPEWGRVASDPSRAQYGWCAASDEARGLMVASKGLCEYELYDDAGGTLAITLLRCTGALARLGAAGEGEILDDGGQCIGEYEFEYSILPFSGEWLSSTAAEADAFLAPPLALHVAQGAGSAPATTSWLELAPCPLLLTAVKQAEDGSGDLIARCFNPLPEAVEATLKLGVKATQLRLAALDETPGKELHPVQGVLKLEVAPKQIVTLRITR